MKSSDDRMPQPCPRIRENFDRGWLFLLGDAVGAQKKEYPDTGWRKLNLPHDWSIEGAFDETCPTGGSEGYLPAGIGWYRKHFMLPTAFDGKHVSIVFDGVFMNADVYLNGSYLGSHAYGYTGFCFDLTPYLRWGGADNTLAVRVDNERQPNSRWYTGSGIYRHTFLEAVDNVHVADGGIYVTTSKILPDYAMLSVKTRIENCIGSRAEVQVVSSVLDAQGKETARQSLPASVGGHSGCEVSQQVIVWHPQTWSADTPVLYRLSIKIIVDGTPVDSCETPFGIRTVLFDADRGFLINGQKIILKGVCLHHDGGCVGAAVPRKVWEKRLKTLKTMGCNAIRTAHNPPAREFLDLCDALGFYVMDEAFDEWYVSKEKGKSTEHGLFEFFDANADSELAGMLLRDRNHPCVALWSVGNEIPEQSSKDGANILKRLVDICHRLDESRPVTLACDRIEAQPEKAAEAFLAQLDVVGYNYVDRWDGRTETMYATEHHSHPAWKLTGSENMSVVGIRGDYGRGDFTSYKKRPYYAKMLAAELLWKFIKVNDYVAGDFFWTGIDYIGEEEWPYKNSSCGALDTCGFPKDAFYFYQSQWTDEPMLYVMPHWNLDRAPGEIVPVVCYTNCDCAELWLNGKSYGEKAYEYPRQGMTQTYLHFDRPLVYATTADLHLTWDIPYEPGTIRVIGKKNGEVICEEKIETVGEPAALLLEPDTMGIRADGEDICQFTVKVVDERGRVCPTAENQIVFTVQGEGSLIGVDNGRPDSHECYKGSERKAFCGLCLAIVQSGEQAGRLRISADSEGLRGCTVEVDVTA